MSFTFTRDSNKRIIKNVIPYKPIPTTASKKTSISSSIDSLTIGSTKLLVSADDLNKLNTTSGTASANKILYLNSNKDIVGIETLKCGSLTVNGVFLTGILGEVSSGISNNPVLIDVIPGSAVSGKALITDSSNNITGINSITTDSIKVNNNKIRPKKQINEVNIYNDFKNVEYFGSYEVNYLFKKIAYSSSLNLFVAIGTTSADRIKTSTNGYDWTIQSIPTSASVWESVAWSPELNLFVAVSSNGTNRQMKSSNGINWTEITGYGSSAFKMIIWTGNMFVACTTTTSTSNLLRSTDGINWYVSSASSGLTISSLDTTTIDSVNYILIGYTNFSVSKTSDISNWAGTTVLTASASTTTIKNIMYSPLLNKYVIAAVGSTISNGSAYSTNFTSWSATSITNNTIAAPSVGGAIWYPYYGIFIAFQNKVAVTGIPNYIFYSFDGIKWNTYPFMNLQNTVGAVIADGLKSIIFYSNAITTNVSYSTTTTIRYKSNTDSTYNLTNLYDTYSTCRNKFNLSVKPLVNISGINTNNWSSICYSPDLELTVVVSSAGANSRIITSTDAISWVNTESQSFSWKKVIWDSNNQKFICVSTDTIMTSNDGIVWNIMICPSGNYVSIASSNNSIVCIGNESNIIKSIYGIIWDSVICPTGTWKAICWSDTLNIYCAVGESCVMISSNGDSWASGTPISGTWNSICWYDKLGLFIAVGNTGLIMTSIDGLTWINRVSGTSNDLNNIISCPDIQILLATSIVGTISYSYDGITWFLHNYNGTTYPWADICYNSDISTIIVPCTNGTICSTYPIIVKDKNSTYINPSKIQVNNKNYNMILNNTNSTTIDAAVSTTLSINSDNNNNLRLSNSGTGYTNIYHDGTKLNIELNGTDKKFNIASGVNFSLNNINLLSTPTELRMLKNIEPGLASANKTIIPDSSNNISNINNLSCDTIVINNKILPLSNDSSSNYISNVIAGTITPSKAIIPDSNLNISGINKCIVDNVVINNNTFEIDNRIKSVANFIPVNNNTISNQLDIQNCKSVCWNPDLNQYCCIMNNTRTNKCILIIDGTNYTQHYPACPTILWNGICWSHDLLMYVAVGSTPSDNTFNLGMYSYDGYNWETSVFPELAILNDVCYGTVNGVGMFVAVSSTSPYKTFKSTDGKTWTAHVSSIGGSNITWGPVGTGMFIFTNETTGGILGKYSTDGTTWLTTDTSGFTSKYEQIIWAGGDINKFIIVCSTGTSNRIAYSSNGTSWTTGITGSNLMAFTGIAFKSPNLLVAMTNTTNNSVWTSADAITWNKPNINLALNTNTSMSCNGTSFISVGTSSIGTSNNGIDWVFENTSLISYVPSNIKIISDLNIYLLSSVSGTVKTYYGNLDSYDEKMGPYNSYTQLTKITQNTVGFYEFEWSASLGLIVGVSSTAGYIYTSTNGIDWSLTNLNNSFVLRSICYNPITGLFIAVANSGVGNRVFVSSNGTSWTQYSATDNTIAWTTITYGNGVYVAASSTAITGNVMYSTNGSNWVSLGSLFAIHTISKVKWIPEINKFVLTINASNKIYLSSDGITWESSVFSSGNVNINYPVYLSTLDALCLYSSNNLVYISVDNGLTWNNIYIDSDGNTDGSVLNTFVDYSYKHDMLIMVNGTPNNPVQVIKNMSLYKDSVDYSNVINSTNYNTTMADSWTALAPTAPNKDIKCITYSNEFNSFVALTSTSSSSYILTSPTGLATWTILTISETVGYLWASICYAPNIVIKDNYTQVETIAGRFIGISPDGRILYNTSQTNITLISGWITLLIPNSGSTEWNCVCHSPELNLFCAVALSGTNRVMISPDGLIWSNISIPELLELRSVCWSSKLGLFCIVASSGTNRVMTSPDGITWTSRLSATTNNWQSVCWDQYINLFIAVSNTGTNDRVMTSPDGITWTSRLSAADINWIKISSSNNGIILAVANSGISNRFMVSYNGIDWVSKTNSEDNNFTDISYSNRLSKFVVVSSDGTNRIFNSNVGNISSGSVISADQWIVKINPSNSFMGINTTTPIGTLHVNGTAGKPGTNTWSYSSDKRLKEDIITADEDKCIELINKLDLVDYEMKATNRHVLGWIADSVELLIPSSVSINPVDGYKYLSIGQIITNMYGSTRKLNNIMKDSNNKLDELELLMI